MASHINQFLESLKELATGVKSVQESVKDDPELNKKLLQASKNYQVNAVAITELLGLIKGSNVQNLSSTVESLKSSFTQLEASVTAQSLKSTSLAWTMGSRMTALESSQATLDSKVSLIQQDTAEIKSMMMEMFQVFKGTSTSSSVTPTLAITDTQANVEGENVPEAPKTEEQEAGQPSHTEGEYVTEATPISEVPPQEEPVSSTLFQVKGKSIATTSEPEERLQPASKIVRVDPDEPIRVPYEINGKIYQLTHDQIQDYMERVEKAAKAAEEEKLSKPELIQVVHEEAEKIGLDTEALANEQAGAAFKKAQEEEMNALKREREAKLKKDAQIRKTRVERYHWVMKERLKPETITDIKIHRNTKPAMVTVFRGADKRVMDTHNPFKFADFGITELDELRPIIAKKNNVVVPDLLKSLNERYNRLRAMPEALNIPSLLPAPTTGTASSTATKRKRKHIESEPEVKVPGLDCDRSVPEGITFVNNTVLETPERGLCFTDEYGDLAFQSWSDIDKAGAMVSYLMLASPIQSGVNQRFCMDLRAKIEKHPEKHLLRSKKAKIEGLGYHLNI
jgi:hypothetical protein